jgi:hypothetical protein
VSYADVFVILASKVLTARRLFRALATNLTRPRRKPSSSLVLGDLQKALTSRFRQFRFSSTRLRPTKPAALAITNVASKIRLGRSESQQTLRHLIS